MAFWAWGLPAAAAALIQSNPADEMNRITSGLVQAAKRYIDDGKSEGISIAVTRCGHTAFVVSGLADTATRDPVTPDTPFEIGSVSKTFTALLLAHAVVDGRARLEDDVRRYLPGKYPNLQWSDDKGITLGELADTTAGLPDYLPDPAPIARLPADQQLPAASRLLANYANKDFLDDLPRIALVSRPGSAARHSNVAAQMLGYIVGRLYGLSFEELLSRKIERPIGMRSGRSKPARVATGYIEAGKAAPPFDGQSIRPAGGLRYSGRDMARFLTLQAAASDPAVVVSHRLRFREAADRQLAFTWVRSPADRGMTRFRMSGGTFGSSSYVEFYPAIRYGIVVFANRGSGSTQDELQAMAEQAFGDVGSSLGPCPAA